VSGHALRLRRDDLIYDTTQSLNEVPGNAQIAPPDSYGGTRGRLTVSIRNSRLGIRIRAPEWHHIRTSANVEMDFLGTQATTTSEAATFTSPLIARAPLQLKIETPVLDFMFGQSGACSAGSRSSSELRRDHGAAGAALLPARRNSACRRRSRRRDQPRDRAGAGALAAA